MYCTTCITYKIYYHYWIGAVGLGGPVAVAGLVEEEGCHVGREDGGVDHQEQNHPVPDGLQHAHTVSRYPANPDIEAVFWAGDDRPEGTVAVLAAGRYTAPIRPPNSKLNSQTLSFGEWNL